MRVFRRRGLADLRELLRATAAVRRLKRAARQVERSELVETRGVVGMERVEVAAEDDGRDPRRAGRPERRSGGMNAGAGDPGVIDEQNVLSGDVLAGAEPASVEVAARWAGASRAKNAVVTVGGRGAEVADELPQPMSAVVTERRGGWDDCDEVELLDVCGTCDAGLVHDQVCREDLRECRGEPVPR